jgi:hypothetical protein
MSNTQVQFLSTPEEQIKWLTQYLANDGIWWVLRRFPPNWGISAVTGTELLNELQFTKVDDIGGLQLFIGRCDLVPSPVWRTTDVGERDIDFVRSRAIQYDPSLLVDEHILLEGQMAIMRRNYYQEVGIDPNPLRAWFREVATRFRKLHAGCTVVLRDLERGTESKYPNIVATRGAVEWRLSGHLLKQFAKGAYEFDVLKND